MRDCLSSYVIGALFFVVSFLKVRLYTRSIDILYTIFNKFLLVIVSHHSLSGYTASLSYNLVKFIRVSWWRHNDTYPIFGELANQHLLCSVNVIDVVEHVIYVHLSWKIRSVDVIGWVCINGVSIILWSWHNLQPWSW